MGKPYIYVYQDKGYARRHRKYTMQDGSDLNVLVTRYTYKLFYKPAEGPRGGRAKKECARSIYYKAGVFYRACNIKLADGEYVNSIKPFEGFLWDAHQTSSRKQGVPIVSIECVEGIPVSVKNDDGTEIWAWGINTITELEELLHIPEQDRATVEDTTEATSEVSQVTETEEVTEIEAEPEVTELEAARVTWLESTSCEGQQLDLIAYFGYGDASWQELANVA